MPRGHGSALPDAQHTVIGSDGFEQPLGSPPLGLHEGFVGMPGTKEKAFALVAMHLEGIAVAGSLKSALDQACGVLPVYVPEQSSARSEQPQSVQLRCSSALAW